MYDYRNMEEDCAPDCQERAECPNAGSKLHLQCGYCEIHDAPSHHCSCSLDDTRYSGLDSLLLEPRFPEGTPEYEEYAAKLREELRKYLAGEDSYGIERGI